MSSWGNTNESTNDQDMISGAAHHRILKVNDVEDGEGSGDNKIALHTKNSSTAANARALEVVGKTYLNGLTEIEDNLTLNAECRV